MLENTDETYEGVIASHFMTQAGIDALLTDIAKKPTFSPDQSKDADAQDVRLQSLMVTA